MTKDQKNKIIDNLVAKIKQEIARRVATNSNEYQAVMRAIDEVVAWERK